MTRNATETTRATEDDAPRSWSRRHLRPSSADRTDLNARQSIDNIKYNHESVKQWRLQKKPTAYCFCVIYLSCDD